MSSFLVKLALDCEAYTVLGCKYNFEKCTESILNLWKNIKAEK